MVMYVFIFLIPLYLVLWTPVEQFWTAVYRKKDNRNVLVLCLLIIIN